MPAPASDPASVLPPSARPAERSLGRLRSTLDRFKGRPQDPPPPEDRSRSATVGENVQMLKAIAEVQRQAPSGQRAFVTGMTTGAILALPYPAVVYRVAAQLLRESDCPGLTVCVANGPHVPGDDCPVVKIEDLLQGVADALDPPAPARET